MLTGAVGLYSTLKARVELNDVSLVTSEACRDCLNTELEDRIRVMLKQVTGSPVVPCKTCSLYLLRVKGSEDTFPE